MDADGIKRAGAVFPRPLGLLRPLREGELQGGAGLFRLIERLHDRWRLRRLIDGLTLALASWFAILLACAWLLGYWLFDADAAQVLRLVVGVSFVLLIWSCCLPPLRRRETPARVARYLEERTPGLGSMVSSAVDASSARGEQSGQLIERLVERALAASVAHDYGDAVEAPKLRAAATRLWLLAMLALAVALWPPAMLRHAVPVLLQPWADTAEYTPFRIDTGPGDVEIARGGDLLFNAITVGFNESRVLLHSSGDGGQTWRETLMTDDAQAGVHEVFLFNIETDLDYYVTAASLRSPVHRVTVTDLPAIETLALRYHHPSYTRRPPETVEGGGDVSALRGTRIEVLITATIPIPGGVLVFGDGASLPLAGAGNNWFGVFEVDGDGVYRIQLQRADGKLVDVSSEFRITALDDLLPDVKILTPGQDMKVSMVEEPLLRMRASDDQGLAALDLVLSINGETERRIALLTDDDPSLANREIEAEHVVYLEDLGLDAGDLVSYYVETRERAPARAARSAITDMYFYQVRPFRNDYRRDQQQGAGGGGGGGQAGGMPEGMLAEQQKQFVVATFNMIRDRARYSEASWDENLNLLETAQSRIRDRVEAIIRRIGPRVLADKRYGTVTEEMNAAVTAMQGVEGQLGERKIDAALPEAQVALKHLQRADAVFRDINISMGQQNGQGGGQGANSGQDLADLFRLEMDRLRNQYETLPQGSQQGRQEAVDEALQRLRELARRQQQEVERWLRRDDQAQSEADAARQRALAEQLEAMARELERLTREQPDRETQRSINQMRDAAEAMRQAAGSSNNDGIQQARQAMERLQEAERLLDQGRMQRFSEEVQQALRRADSAGRRQQEIAEAVRGLESDNIQALRAELERMDELKKKLDDELAELETDLARLADDARDEQPESGQSLRQALRTGREYRLRDRIERTRQMILRNALEHGIANEDKIAEGINEMRDEIAQALDQVGESNGRGLARELERMRDMARELRALRERRANQIAEGEGRGADGGADAGGANGGTADANSRYGGSADINMADLSRRVRSMGSRLSDQGVEEADVETLLDRIERLAAAEPDAATGMELHDAALRALLDLEFSLRGRLEEGETAAPPLIEAGEPPDDYRDMIAEYYRSLSR